MLRAVQGPVAAGGVLLAFAFYVLGALFGLNGGTWVWWRWGSWAAAVVTLLMTAYLATRRTRVRFTFRRGPGTAIVIAVAAIAVPFGFMAQHFNDSYGGNLVWPHLLACVAFAGFLVGAAAILRSAR